MGTVADCNGSAPPAGRPLELPLKPRGTWALAQTVIADKAYDAQARLIALLLDKGRQWPFLPG